MKVDLSRILLLALLFLSVQFSYAQKFTATGTVTDETGEALIGATVLAKGTTTGVVTDFDGSYSISVDGDQAILVFSYTGFTTQEISVTSATPSTDVVMIQSAEQLSEVVVTGYGTTRKEALTGSVTTLQSAKLESVPLASVEQTLQGNIAGLQANMGNGQPGANVQIRIRGQGSISASSEPLFVIDGIPVLSNDFSSGDNPDTVVDSDVESSNPLATINPNDIETVTVLKDASATAIYGARAANGVILITTKSGKSGKPKLRLTAQVGANDWAVSEDKRLRGLTAEEYSRLYVEGWVNTGETVEQAIERFNGRYPDPLTGQPAVDLTPDGNGGVNIGTIRVDNRWIDELTRTGLNQDYNLSVSGGNDVITYYASGGYFNQEAPIIYSSLDRYSTRLNLRVKASDRLRITNNLSISRTHQQGMNDGTRWANPLYNGYLLAPVIPARDAEGRFYGDHKTFFMGGNNPIGSLSGDDDQEWTMVRIIDNITGEYDIVKGLTFRTAWSVDLLNYQENYFRNARYGDGRNSNGDASELTRNVTNWIGTQTLTYDHTFGSNHNFNALVGYEAQETTTRSVRAFGEEFPPNSQLRVLSNAAAGDPSQSALVGFAFESIFSRISYNYNYKYYLQGSVRRDGSSRFGSDNRYGTFWSVGASWRLDQEPFVQEMSFINELKLRTSYGTTGNAGIGNFDWLPQISYSDIDYNGNPGGAFLEIGNRALTWEQNNTFNIGLDFGLFNRLSGTVEFFNRESENLLLDVPVSRTTGFRDATRNFGAMRNRGLELTINADIVRTEDVTFSIGGNITFIKNEITKLDEPFVDGTHDRFLRMEGRDYNEYHVFEWAGVDVQTGAPLFYVDENKEATTSDINDIERYFIGKSGTPDFFGGFNTNFRWKGFSIDAQFNYSWNNWLYDATAWVLQGDGRFTPRSQTNLVLNRWQQPGDVTDVPQFSWGNRSNSNLRGSSRFIHDGTYIRLRNLTIGYQLPTAVIEKVRLSSARIYLRGTNLLTWTRDENLYLDPEASINGLVNSPVPNMKTASIGIDLGF